MRVIKKEINNMKIEFKYSQEKEFIYLNKNMKVKDILNINLGSTNYCLGEFPDGSVKGFVFTSQNEIQNIWRVGFNERQAYESYIL